MGGDSEMKGKIRWVWLVTYIGTVVPICAGYLIYHFTSDWVPTTILYLLAMYFIMHLPLGPLDWYLMYKIYKKLRRR